MPKTRRKGNRLRIGDIVEIETPMGLAFVQYTQHDKEVYGEMIRVLPGIRADRPERLSDLARSQERYFTFTPLQALVRAGDVAIIGNEPIPPYAGSIKLTVRAGEPYSPTKEEKDLSVDFSIVGLARLVDEICSDWSPKHDGRSTRERDRAVLTMLRQAGSNVSLPHEITHKIHFPRTGRKSVDRSRENAEQTAERLKSEGFEVELERESLGWWLFAKCQVVPTEQNLKVERRFMEDLSERWEGRYAGWLPKANRG